MALVSSFSFTNTTSHTVDVTPISLGVVTNYAKVADVPNRYAGQNKTASIGQGELLTYGCDAIKDVNTDQKVYNPGKVKDGVRYRIRLDEILRTTDTTDPTFVVDDPIVMELSIKHTMSGNVTPAIIEAVFKRLIGACMRSDGSFRFNDLMVSGLAPMAD
jgi:hypothetical protein